jgi:hypothetical protein
MRWPTIITELVAVHGAVLLTDAEVFTKCGTSALAATSLQMLRVARRRAVASAALIEVKLWGKRGSAEFRFSRNSAAFAPG